MNNFNYPKAPEWLDPTSSRTRRFPRVEARGNVILTNGLDLIFGELRNISIGGFAITSNQSPPPGSLWKTVLRLESGEIITPAQAIVIRSDNDRSLIALEFTSISNQHRLVIGELVASKRMEKAIGGSLVDWRQF
jgi:hypothetical protein